MRLAFRPDGGISAFLKYPEECRHCGSWRQDCPEGVIEIVFPTDMLSI